MGFLKDNSEYFSIRLVALLDWFEVKTMPELERFEPYKFEYAPTRDLDEILNSLVN